MCETIPYLCSDNPSELQILTRANQISSPGFQKPSETFYVLRSDYGFNFKKIFGQIFLKFLWQKFIYMSDVLTFISASGVNENIHNLTWPSHFLYL